MVRRVMVVSFAEGETAPAKYQKIDDNYYLVETLELSRPVADNKGDRRGPRKGKGGPKSSPWGLSPEEKAAKNKGGQTPKPTT